MTNSGDKANRISRHAPIYGQVVVGAPGSGKTTFCNGMQQYLKLLGRNVWVINLDPANDFGTENYEAVWNVIENVVHLRKVMEDLELGPNGGLVYCMEYLDQQSEEWIPSMKEAILESMNKEDSNQPYIIFDLPGQSEVYTHGTAVSSLLQKLVKQLDLRICVVQLVDATQCRSPPAFLSSTLLGLAAMIRLELPTVNILSKTDLILGNETKDLLFGMDFFLDCRSLELLADYLDGSGTDMQDDNYMIDIADDAEYQAARYAVKNSSFWQKHRKLYKALAEVVEDYGLLNFAPLDVQNATSVGQVLRAIDQANGFVFIDQVNKEKVESLFNVAVQETENRFESIADIQERLSRNTENNDDFR